jgi:hypothetical protein
MNVPFVDLKAQCALHYDLVFTFLHVEDVERLFRRGPGRGQMHRFHGDGEVEKLVLADYEMPEHAGRDGNLGYSGRQPLDIDLDRLHGRLFLGLFLGGLHGRRRGAHGSGDRRAQGARGRGRRR